MGLQVQPTLALVIAAGLLATAFIVFARVRADYATHGRLSRPVMVLQTGYFCLYALSSYLFLDARLSRISARGLLLAVAILLMALGVIVFLLAVPMIGRKSFTGEVEALRHSGIYRHSRNPQLVGGFLFIVGYALLWLSWIGLMWAALWLPISHLMVKAEEEHLSRVFGEAYRDYCRRTPRYVGVSKR